MEISLAAEKIGQIDSLPVTNSMVLSWIASMVLIAVSLLATRKMTLVPAGLQNVFETVVEFLYDTVNNVFGDERITKKYFPFIATFFIFILANNWLGTLPGVGSIGFNEAKASGTIFVPLLRPGNADLNHTLALAAISVIVTQFIGVTAIGFFKYAGKFLNFKGGPIGLFVGLLELVGEFTRVLSFSFRLFGNIFAGEVLLTVMMSILPFIAPIPFTLLELFVGLIQALVFTMLTLVFIKIAIAEHSAEH
jgi:F-type H+-transporting ATPase subunit a